MAVEYGVVITNSSGVETNAIPPRNLKLTRRRSDASEGSVEVEHSRSLTGISTTQGIKVYRNGTLVFFGLITGITRKAHMSTLNFVDPFGLLQYRHDTGIVANVGTVSGPSLVSTLLTRLNASTVNPHLTMGSLAAPTSYTLTNKYTSTKAQDAASIITDLASAATYGFYFTIDPVDGAGATFANLNTFLTLTDLPAVSFEWGDGTRNNIQDDWTVDNALPIPQVTVFGNPATTGGVTFQGAPSTTPPPGLSHVVRVDISNPPISIMAAVGSSFGTGSNPNTYTIHGVPDDGNNLPWIPSAWDDFDIDNTCRLTLMDDQYTDQNITVAVNEFSVQASNESRSERLTDVALQLSTGKRLAANPRRGLENVLGVLDRRVRVLERQPQ